MNIQKLWKQFGNGHSQAIDETKIPIELSDSVIMSPDGVRLAWKFEGKEITITFPLIKDFDNYVAHTAKLYLVLAAYIDDLQVTDLESIDKNVFHVWATLVSAVLRHKKIYNLVMYIFFTYLQPKIDGVRVTKKVLQRNITIDHIVDILISILSVEDWLKKKSQSTLEKTFQMLTSPPSKNRSTKHMDSPLIPIPENKLFKVD